MGTARPCFLTNAWEGAELTAKKERIIQWTAAGIYSGTYFFGPVIVHLHLFIRWSK